MNNLIIKEDFIKKANLKYSGKYDYSKVNYINYRVKVCIICPKHGDFLQTPNQHLLTKYGCPKCANDIIELKVNRKTTDEFIRQAKEIHGDKYDYSKTTYINGTTKVCITCPEHGEFWQLPNNHLNGSGCPKCALENKTLYKRKEKFIKKATELYGDKYDYSYVKYIKSNKGVTIFDKEKQIFFLQSPTKHLKGIGYNESNIIAWFQANNKLYDYYYQLAKQYDDIYNLYLEHKKCFRKMKTNNWLKDYAWLKNNREAKVKKSVVYSYEFSDHSVYVGLTNSLNRRDQQHRERRFHPNGKLQYDGVLDYSLKYNIEIPDVKILANNLTREESGLEEIKWIQYYKDNGWKIINRNRGGATGMGVINKSKWTHETVIEEAKKYKNMDQMRIENHSAYKYMERWNLKKDCFPDAKLQVHQPNRLYTKELIEETVRKCPRKTDLRNMDMAMYQYLFSHGLLYEFYPKEKNGKSFLKK